MNLPKPAREILKMFRKAGLSVEVQPGSRHFRFMLGREHVFSVHHGSRICRAQKRSARETIKALQAGKEVGPGTRR